MAYLWVSFQYSDTPGPMGFFCSHPEEVWVRVDERLFFGGLFGQVVFPMLLPRTLLIITRILFSLRV